MTLQRQVTAEHEAAHAVLYLALGYPLHRIEIDPDWITQSTPEQVARPVWDLAVISIGGVVIEDRYRTQPLEKRTAEAVDARSDPDLLAELGDMALFSEHPHLAEPAYDVATTLLEQHADVHAEIATALLEIGSLNGDDVAALPLAGAMLRERSPR